MGSPVPTITVPISWSLFKSIPSLNIPPITQNPTIPCPGASTKALQCLKKGRSAVFFSATLLPVRYYREQLGGTEEDYAVYAPTPFDKEKRLIMVGADVSTKYSMRGEEQYASQNRAATQLPCLQNACAPAKILHILQSGALSLTVIPPHSARPPPHRTRASFSKARCCRHRAAWSYGRIFPLIYASL